MTAGPPENPMRYWEDQELTAGGPAVVYKVTDKDAVADGRLWSVNGAHEAVGDGYLAGHCHPVLAVMLNSAKWGVAEPLALWECEAEPLATTPDGEVRCRRLTPRRRLTTPRVGQLGRVRFGMACANKVYRDDVFAEWILDFLCGSDRTPARAMAMSRRCEAVAAAEQGANGPMTPLAWAARASTEASWAGAMFSDVNGSSRLAYHVAAAALCAGRAARAAGGSLDLTEVIEITLTPR